MATSTETSERVRRDPWSEVHHRVKNEFQVVASLLSLQARAVADPRSRRQFEASQDRVRAIALVHEKLHASAAPIQVDVRDYVTTLVANLVRSRDGAAHGVTADLEVADVFLPLELAIPCGLIVNELVTNALEHAFVGDRRGNVTVALHDLSPEELELVVSDDGVGLPRPLDPQRIETLGFELVFTFAEQLEATVMVEGPPGATFRLHFPQPK